MTAPSVLPDKSSAASNPVSVSTLDTAGVTALKLPGSLFAVRAEQGARETIVCPMDFERASIAGNTIQPAWSSAELVIATYRLGQVFKAAKDILHAEFGANASITAGIDVDHEADAPMLVFRLDIEPQKRGLRTQFFDRYVRETSIPEGAPVPVLYWTYDRALPA